MTRSFLATGLMMMVVGAAAPPPIAAEAATPQRPSLSFSTATVPGGRFEVEAGANVLDEAGALPLFLKYGLADRHEIELGFDAVRQVDTGEEVETSFGDVTVGLRSRLVEREAGAFAVVGWVKAPTAGDETGSGEADAGVVAVGSWPAGRFSLDANLWLSAIGQENATAGQVQGVVTLGIPLASSWSTFVEVAWQRTAGQGSGRFFDTGIAYAATPTAVFDRAAGVGGDEGYPDWAVTAGWTVLTDPGRPPHGAVLRDAHAP